MTVEPAEQNKIFLSTLPADRGARRLALAAVVVSAAIFLAVAPFAKLNLPAVWAFIPVYQSALVVGDVITAILLFGQVAILRSRALLALACAYLLSACMGVFHALSFPGLFAPAGVLSGGPQTTAWLYFLWHAAFPLLIIAYALLDDRERAGASANLKSAPAIIASVAAVVAVACGLALLTIAGHDVLPVIMRGNDDDSAKVLVATATWMISVVALWVLWRRRSPTVLDLWLMVTLCAWIFDVALASVLNHARFDLGYYAGRVYGLLASNFVLAVLLLENNILYSRIVAANDELVIVNKELESFSYSVSHDLRSPLRAIDGYSRMLEEDYAEKFDDEARRMLAVVRENSGKMNALIEDLLAFSRLGRQRIALGSVDMNALVNEILHELAALPRAALTDVVVEPLPPASGDRNLLKQVLTNLLSNAIKYSSKKDTPRVVVAAGRQSGENIYRIEDNGAGFDMQYYKKLFGVFQRLHTADEFPGTGVGLAIVQRVVTRHGGRVWAESTLGEGATFYFTLPAA